MAVVIRLARFGSTHSPKYRVTVADQRYAPEKKFIAVIGTYNPSPRGQDKGLVINMDLYKEWVGKGAQPTDRVKKLIKKVEASAQS